MNIPRQKIPIKKAFFSAEPYPPSLRTIFEEDYGMITSQGYATADWVSLLMIKPARHP